MRVTTDLGLFGGGLALGARGLGGVEGVLAVPPLLVLLGEGRLLAGRLLLLHLLALQGAFLQNLLDRICRLEQVYLEELKPQYEESYRTKYSEELEV